MKRSFPTDVELFRRRLDTPLEPVDVLRLLRDEPGLVALIGAWHHGDALIGFNPERFAEDPFDGIDLEPIVADGAFGGGWIGAWGYQLGMRLERLPDPPRRPVPRPDFTIGFYDYVLRRTDGDWWFEALITPARAALIEAELGRLGAVLAGQVPAAAPYDVGSFDMTPSPRRHKAVIAEALERIRAGEIFQANLCVRLSAPFFGDPLDVFCRGIERLKPAYAAFVRSDKGALVSMSPELFLRRTGRDVLSSPIKGTAPLDVDAQTLAVSSKNRAENIMIVDLVRNDLGRVCVPGSVHVPAINRVERHAVWHLVSDVSARLRPEAKDSDLLRATFPPGSVTGAPKVRAMTIINTLEATGREAYTGAIGHVSPCAGLELNVVIRTFEFAGDQVWLGVGGGIVADSTAGDEYAECLVKARPLIEAIGGRLEFAANLDDSMSPARIDVASVDVKSRSLKSPELESPLDRSLGIFETMLVLHGQVVDADRHLARLEASLLAVYGARLPRDLVDSIERASKQLSGRHRLRVTVSPAGEFTIVAASAGADAESWTLFPRMVHGGLGEHKWVDRRRLEALSRPDQDLLLIDRDGTVLETGRASLFVVGDDGVHTPMLDGRILPGTARARVIEILTAAGIPVFERRLTTDDLARATEVFATNALRGVVPVLGCDGIGRWNAGRITQWLRSRWVGGRSASSSQANTVAEPSTAYGRGKNSARVLLIDNYDSFVHNLAQYFGELGAAATVVRNDEISVAQLVAAQQCGEITHLVVSPGPGTPDESGVSNDAIAQLGPRIPTLGVCLGHQCIGQVFGAAVVPANEIVHGKPALIQHDGQGVFAGLADPLVAARYHSLVIDRSTLPDCLDISATTPSGVIMGVRHRIHRIEGVQMHPESILTPTGHIMLQNFLQISPPK